MHSRLWYAPLAVAVIAAVTLVGDDAPTGPVTAGARLATLRAARVWTPTNVATMNMYEGPTGPDAFVPGQIVDCRFVPRSFDGSTPKFECALDGSDEVKIKYGRHNGEVYSEVAASRLLWALGFGADRMYPVRVRCRGCPTDENGAPTRGDPVQFDAAVIERRFPGEGIVAGPGRGWSWSEIEFIDQGDDAAERSHRDALKLLAAMLQHTDNKPEQQRVVCLSPIQSSAAGPVCDEPFLLIQDLGKMFGRADYLNRDFVASVNLREWQQVPVWTDATRCIARLDTSVTGTLHDPRIGEAGRAFLAGLLNQLADAQLRDLFAVAQFDRRVIAGQPPSSTDDWVAVFKEKRRQIEEARCPP